MYFLKVKGPLIHCAGMIALYCLQLKLYTVVCDMHELYHSSNQAVAGQIMYCIIHKLM